MRWPFAPWNLACAPRCAEVAFWMRARGRRLNVFSVALVAVLAGACSSVDPDPQWAERAAVVVEADAFKAREGLLDGFDAPLRDRELEPGDRVLFGLRLERHGEVRDWYLDVEVVDPAAKQWLTESGTTRHQLRARATVFAGDGRELGREVIELSREDLTRGLSRACRGEEEPRVAEPSPLLGTIPERVRADLALFNLLTVVRKSKVLDGLLWQVIDKPSLWSVIVHLGVHVRKHSAFDLVRAGAPFGAGDVALPTWELPVEVTINDAPALRSIVVVTDPDSPLALCAGVVAITATHPSDPGITFSMRLLAARRAP